MAVDISRSPFTLPGWPHSRKVLIYDTHTGIYNRECIKRYLGVTTIAKDGLLVHNPVPQIENNTNSKIFLKNTQCIIQETANETDPNYEDYKQVRQVITFEHASE